MIWELTRRRANVKVIAMSSDSGALNVAKFLGAQQTFQKPVDMEELLSAVRYDLAS